MAGPSPGSLVSSGQSGSLHNVLFYVPQNGNGNQFANEACHNQHGGTLSHLSYMQTSHNRYRPDTGLNKVHCFPTDNPYSCDRDTNGSYWSYQQHQQQWNQWNQNDYNHSESFGFKSCWMQQQQQQQQSMQQRHSMQNNNPSCMGFNPQYNHMQQQQQHQQMQQQQQQQHMLQQSGYRNNVVATVTVQSTSQSLSRTPSRCDSVRSETCESHCSSSLSGGSGAMDDMTGQQYGMYQNFASVHPQQQQQHQQLQQQQYPQHEEHVQQQQQQCFWPSSHYDMQQDQQQQMDYFRQQQMQHQQQQQQQHYYRQHQVMQQQQQTNCYWPRDSSPVIQQQQTLPPQQHQQQQQSRQFACAEPVVMETPICSSSPIVADTTTISSPTSSPQYSSVDESMECAPVPPADDSMESSTEIPPATTSPPPPDAATAPVISISVPVGWTRDVSGGSVIYISPSGCRLSSLEDVATYVQRDGTCKCGLPCPLRLQHVFNFDPSVPCNADETSLDAPTTCCHKQSLDATSDKSPQPSIKTASVKRKKSAHNKANKSPKILPEQPEQQQQQPLLFRRSPCPNVDVRQIPAEQNRPPAGSLLPSRPGSGPTFFEDPSAYLAQQTVLLQSSLQNGTASSSPSPQTEATTEPEQTQEELLGDLLDCIPDSMEEVLDRQKDVAAAAEAAAQAEKAANLIKQATATAPPPPPPVKQQQPKPPQKSPSVPVSLAPARSKPPPLAIRPATPATAAARSRAKAAETSSKSTKSRSPRRTHHQPIQSNAKVLQPAQPQPLIHQQQQQQFWPAISAPNIGPLRTTSFPFHSAPIFSSAAIRPGNLPMTFLTSQPQANGFNQSLPVLTTRPALAPSGQVVHVLTTPGPMLTAAPLAADPSTTVPILTVGPMTNHSNNNNNSRGLTRTGKKRKSTPQTVASILQQGAQLAAMTQQQPQQHPTTLTLSQEPLVAYNVQNFQQIQPQQTIQTLALMPDGKTYVVVNSQPAPAPQPAPQQNTGGHWLLSPRPANTQHPLIAPAGQPVNVFCTTQTPGTTFVLNGTSAPTTQVLQLQDGTLVHTTTTAEQPNLLANYGGLFIRCPTTPATGIFSTSPAVRTLPLPIPIAPGRSPGRSPDSSSIDGVTSSSANAETLVACGEATPPSQVRTAHPSPVVQSSQIDSCTVQEVEITDQDAANKKQAEFNNNVQHWLKPDPKQVAAG